MADLHHLGRGAGPAPRRRAARASSTWPRRPEAGRHLLRRHAAPARPGHDPGRRPADHLPRRADHRPRPAQPPHHVADHPRPGRRRRHHLPHHPVPGGGRRARRPDRACSTTAGSSPRAPPTSSSASSPAGTSSCVSPSRRELESAAGCWPPRRRDDEALTLQVPSDGSARALRSLLDRLDRAAIEVDALSVHTPDLDDVFFALTGQPDDQPDHSARPDSRSRR